MTECPTIQFEKRKREHIELSLDDSNEALGFSGLSRIELQHEALPEINFSEVNITQQVLELEMKTPFLVSSMTAGHTRSVDLNLRLAKACEARGWLMGVGSQRRELFDETASQEWAQIRNECPDVKLLGNIGLSQLIHSDVDSINKLVEDLRASALFVHTNPLQESLQVEGTPHFKGGLEALEQLCSHINVPVILKETGCGFSASTFEKLKNLGLAAVDVSGFGGTHWGRIEGDRAALKVSKEAMIKKNAAQSFSHWGISTVESVCNYIKVKPQFELWSSGGVRTGLDAAKLLAMGSQVVGFAKPILQAALESEEDLDLKMEMLEYELKMALFCTGFKTIDEFQSRGVWSWTKS